MVKKSQILKAAFRSILLLLLLGFFSATASAQQCLEVFEPTRAERTLENLKLPYGEAAKLIVPQALESLSFKIQLLQGNNFHSKTANILRRQILETRFILEVFAPSFARRGEIDPWFETFTTLKRGYSLIGTFKSIPKDKPIKRAKQMAKIQQWAEAQTSGNMHRLITALKAHHSPEVIPRTFPRAVQWDTSLLRPATHKTAEQVFRELSVELLHKAKTNLDSVLRIKDFRDPFLIESFHSFRKELRASYKISLFLGLKTPTNNPLLKQILYDIGKINDKIEPFIKGLEKNSWPPEIIQQKHQKILELWGLFRNRYKRDDILDSLDRLITDLHT